MIESVYLFIERRLYLELFFVHEAYALQLLPFFKLGLKFYEHLKYSKILLSAFPNCESYAP